VARAGPGWLDRRAVGSLGGGPRLEEVRLEALELRVEAELACGGGSELVGELEMLTTRYPLRERLWEQRMLALYRSGRQVDAPRCYQDLRSALISELGIEPGSQARRLETLILRQDPSLEPAPHPRRHRPWRARDAVCGQRGPARRLPGRRGGRAGHRVRTWPDQSPGSVVGGAAHRALLPPARGAGPLDPVRQARHRPVRSRARGHAARGTADRPAGGDGRVRLPPCGALRLLRGCADEPAVRRHSPGSGLGAHLGLRRGPLESRS
jgi:hypothetical protein